MIKCEVIEQFTLKDFWKLKNIQRKSINVKGTLFIGDTFECDEKMVDYLTGNNPLNKVVVKVIEVEPINKDNVLEKLDEALEKLENEELVETIPVIDKNGVVVDRVVKDKPTKKKKTSNK